MIEGQVESTTIRTLAKGGTEPGMDLRYQYYQILIVDQLLGTRF
jgi:hypothetical protein